MRSTATIMVAAIGSIFLAGELKGQANRVTVADRVTCPNCRIELAHVTTLRLPSERVSVGTLPTPSVARDRAGRYVVGTLYGEAPVAVFNTEGSLFRLIGGFGDGPGEFSSSRMFLRVGQGDTLHVFQRVRETVYSPEDYSVQSTRSIALLVSDPVFVADALLIGSMARSPRGESTPVQVLDRERRVVRGIGVLKDRPISADPLDGARRVSRSLGGTAVWITPWTRYEVSRFDLEDREQVRLVRETAWFPGDESRPIGDGYSSPQLPKVEGTFEAQVGLFTMLSLADPTYEVPAGGGPEGPPIDPYTDDNGRLDTRIELIDVDRGEVLARADFDPRLMMVSAPGGDEPVLFSLRGIPSGELVIDIWEAHVVYPKR